MTQSSSASGPIPPARKDDSEDVAWALSTAEAMYARGDKGDALKWLRRAAEAASEEEDDDRALELAKAAADLAQIVGPLSVAPPPPPNPAPLTRPPPVAATVAMPSIEAAPVPAPPPSRPTAPPSRPPPLSSRPAPASVRPAAIAPSPSRPPPTGAPAPTMRTMQSAVSTPRPVASDGAIAPSPARVATVAMGAAAPEPAPTPQPPPSSPSRAARRRRPDIQIARPPDELTEQTTHPLAAMAESLPAESPLAASVQPTPAAPAVADPSHDDARPTPGGEFPPRIAIEAAAASTDEIDAWPTARLAPDELSDPLDEKTRIGVRAYEYNARLATEAPSTPYLADPSVKPSQAVKVVVWRTPDGVRIAPVGTQVAAITVEALLVALDPSADLAAWLTGK